MNIAEIKNNKIFKRVAICIAVLLVGVFGMVMLSKLKKAPAKATVEERPLQVQVVQAVLEDVPVTMTGYGETTPLNVVAISPEVSGTIVQIHPRLKPGEVIAKGELLFSIDPRDYRAAMDEATASVAQWQHSIERLHAEWKTDKKRLQTLSRNKELARSEHLRLEQLFNKDKVGTLSGVEAAERTYNAAEDQFDQITQTLNLYPIRIREAESSIAMARARLSLAKANLERCEVHTVFNARIQEANLELGQYVTPAQQILKLADDTILEIQVSLDSREAKKWLLFHQEIKNDLLAWFDQLKAVPCKIWWTEASADPPWKGNLHRVIAFDQNTRTLTVAIRITGEQATAQHTSFPLVAGMFCRVEIPGQVMKNVIRLPRWAVTFNNEVYIAENDRLKALTVELAHTQGDDVFVSKGVSPGQKIIATRLVDPLDNSLLKVTNTAPSNEWKTL